MKKRGKLLTVIIFVELFLILVGRILSDAIEVSWNSYAIDADIIEIVMSIESYLTVIALAGIWKFKRWGVYLYFLSFSVITLFLFVTYTHNHADLMPSLIISSIAPALLGIGVAKNWKSFDSTTFKH